MDVESGMEEGSKKKKEKSTKTKDKKSC